MNNKYKIIILIVFAIIAGAIFIYYQMGPLTMAENPMTATSITSTTSSLTPEAPIKGCYVAKLAKDVYTLNIQVEENEKVSGLVAFNNFEKDSSSGSFDGTFIDGILTGNYAFDSEVSRSNRQLIFKRAGNTFVEGFGPVKVVDNKEIFDPISAVTFDPKSTFIKSENCSEKFTDSNNVFSFNYNPYFKVNPGYDELTTDWISNAKQKGILLARVSIPRSYLPNTNFSGATFTIGRSGDASIIKTCISDMKNGEKKDGTKTIDGYTFTKFTLSDAGAGNFYDTASYRGIVDGDCYVLEQTIHSTNIGNYSAKQGIKEFDKTTIQSDFDKMLNGFSFLVGN
jgi:hypothetical protein